LTRFWLVALDVAALTAGVFVTFLARAVLRHHELITAGSLATFTGWGLVAATPALLMSFAACGLYAEDWHRHAPTATVAAVGWATAIACFGVAILGPSDAPIATIAPASIAVALAIAAARELARRRRAPSLSTLSNHRPPQEARG
jgi:hypothetical protein